jgi:NAD(P)-dependent dehydrogenase (short-subunit alcohol dehydrogenase family)
MDLSDQVAVVTGAGQGIGKACALAMAKAGSDVAVVDINAESVKETAAEIAALGRRSLALRADLGSVSDIDRMVAETIASFGRIDVLVNNAGVTRRAEIMDLTEEDWDRIHRVNAKGVFFCLQRAAREMIPRRSGRIINIASIAGKGYAGTSNAIYAASKGAVISLTKTAAQQLGPHNINVNAVCPGIVRTAMWREINRVIAEKEGSSPEEVERVKLETVPIRRANEPEDIAAMVVFLASPSARNVSGQSFNVDGGLVPH